MGNNLANEIDNSNSTSIEDNRITEELEVSDEREYGFFILDNKFVDAGFDVFTMAYYMLIVRRAHRNVKGFFEKQKNTCKRLGISESKLKQCNQLLEFCKIIKITRRKHADNPNIQIPSLITLNDKKMWNLNHEHRDAGKFYQLTKSQMDEPLKTKIKEAKAKAKISKVVPLESELTGGLPENPPRVTEKPTVGYQETTDKNEQKEERTKLRKIDAVEKNKISESNKKEEVKTTALKKQSKVLTFRSKPKISFKNAKEWIDNKEEEKLDILLGLACNGHRRAVDLKECPPFDFQKFPTILKPFFDKYPLDLLYQFYSYAEKICASIDVFKSEETLHRWQKMLEREKQINHSSEILDPQRVS